MMTQKQLDGVVFPSTFNKFNFYPLLSEIEIVYINTVISNIT